MSNKEELTVIDNNVYSVDTLKELDKRVKAINTALSAIEKNFIKIAFNLYWVYSSQSYKTMGCESITDFAKQQFDFSKTTTYDFINIVERFGVHDESGKLTSENIIPAYKDYSRSKLSAISGLSDVEIQSLDITPGMSVRDIKKAVKTYEDKLALPSSDKPDFSKGSTDSSKEEKEEPQQELQIDNDNTVLPPSADMDPVVSQDDLEVYCSFSKRDFKAWQSDPKTKDTFIAGLISTMLLKYRDGQVVLCFRKPDKEKGGKKK